jgi:outer membrane protein
MNLKLPSQSSRRCVQAVLLACALSCGTAAVAQGPRIGFVNTERIFREAKPAKAADARLLQEFSKREKDLQEMAARLRTASERYQTDAPTLPDAERSRRQNELAGMERDLQRRQAEFRDDLNQRRLEEKNAFLERTTNVIKQVADAEKIDIVVQQAVVFSARVDITDKVLKALDKSTP